MDLYPFLQDRYIDLYRLYEIVERLGGRDHIDFYTKYWTPIGQELGLASTNYVGKKTRYWYDRYVAFYIAKVKGLPPPRAPETWNTSARRERRKLERELNGGISPDEDEGVKKEKTGEKVSQHVPRVKKLPPKVVENEKPFLPPFDRLRTVKTPFMRRPYLTTPLQMTIHRDSNADVLETSGIGRVLMARVHRSLRETKKDMDDLMATLQTENPGNTDIQYYLKRSTSRISLMPYLRIPLYALLEYFVRALKMKPLEVLKPLLTLLRKKHVSNKHEMLNVLIRYSVKEEKLRSHLLTSLHLASTQYLRKERVRHLKDAIADPGAYQRNRSLEAAMTDESPLPFSPLPAPSTEFQTPKLPAIPKSSRHARPIYSPSFSLPPPHQSSPNDTISSANSLPINTPKKKRLKRPLSSEDFPQISTQNITTPITSSHTPMEISLPIIAPLPPPTAASATPTSRLTRSQQRALHQPPPPTAYLTQVYMKDQNSIVLRIKRSRQN